MTLLDITTLMKSSRKTLSRVALFLSLPLLLASSLSANQGAQPIFAARPTGIELSLPTDTLDRSLRVLAQLPHQSAADSVLVWEGPAAPVIAFPRIHQGVDTLYARFHIQDSDTNEFLFKNQWISDLSQLSPRSFSLPNPPNKKGLNSAVGTEDPQALGARHIVENISIDQLVDTETDFSPYSIEVDRQKVYFTPGYVETLDRRLLSFHAAGMRTLGIFLKTLKWDGSKNDGPLTHPDSELDNSHALIGAFNLSSENAYLYYRAALEFLAQRYTRADAKYGLLAGMIVGNEVQSHSVWYNMGPASIDAVSEHYHKAVRIAHLAGQQQHRDWRVFVSLTHHWNASSTPGDPLRGFSGRAFIDAFSQLSNQSGSFDWGVAWHPYPEDLFEPAFWQNFSAIPYFDSPLVTMKNLEVLIAYLRQPHIRHAGKTREVILSEQGFHGPAGEEPELKQAVALAYALELVQQIPEITAFHLHRHVDHPKEGGLMLGLRQHGSKGAEDIARKKPAYHVFQAFGEDNWLEATQFALDYLKRDSWEGLYAGPESIQPAQPDASALGYIDLYRLFDDAAVVDALSAKPASFLKSAGWLAPSIFLHPKDGIETSMTFELDLPEISADERLRFSFGTGIAGESPSGLTFRVTINGQTRFEEETSQGQYRPHQLDLSSLAGQSISLALIVHPGDSIRYDWAHWIEPQIRVQPRDL